ncbi:5'-adenylylsulfate reductase-like 7 [Pistacia vera]|uniref:5'-adenylylsulfate reductase-like 7 n=1 Tax=Pistacia vera TaxID=55513 RepID=UPI001262F064|nr:5'-adenylylsulfate reductase-like 7 [Pistacia vera]
MSGAGLRFFSLSIVELGEVYGEFLDGEFLDRALSSKQRDTYTSVLFYASWCPFSRSMHPTFEVLSSMFPQMEHFAIEQSSALPSVFSRYGVHSLPSILLVNQTSKLRYRGPKDLHSLVQFYQKTTGLEPVEYFAEDESASLGRSDELIMQSWNRSSLRQMIQNKPYLVFSVFFLCLRLLISIFPEVSSRLKAFWDSYVPHLNLEIFGETSQIFGRALHMIDVRRVLTKLRLCKTRNFREGAKNARVWASLASVSLGESSSSRSSS